MNYISLPKKIIKIYNIDSLTPKNIYIILYQLYVVAFIGFWILLKKVYTLLENNHIILRLDRD